MNRHRLEYAPDEKPGYAFCESVTASSMSPWHIRKVPDGKLRLGGGINTPSLCDRVKPFGEGGVGGWDLQVRITEQHLSHSCRNCAEIYREEVGV